MSNSTKKRASLRSLMWVGNGNTIFKIIVPLDDSGDDALILETLDLIGRQSDDLTENVCIVFSKTWTRAAKLRERFRQQKGGARSRHLNSSSQHLFRVQ